MMWLTKSRGMDIGEYRATEKDGKSWLEQRECLNGFKKINERFSFQSFSS